ncbi:Ribosomal RNA small subunit methyltransferase C (plasmid) [Pseudoseohaeicola sp. NH-UV-7]|uniref:class I SAM-dependent methyltransferase n=1 Tax=Sulfitobacter sp. TBRI5 TaxID=2989732 RepID=UPI003A66D8ED
MSARLTLALNAGGLVLPDTGKIAVFHPRDAADLAELTKARLVVVQPFRPDYDALSTAGYDCRADGADLPPCAASLVFLPRAKALARALVAGAAACSDGLVIVDGAKTDGIDSILRDVKKRTTVSGPLSKAHGKLFWFDANAADWSDWAARPAQISEGFQTLPGVFSADGIDPASALLAAQLPAHLGGVVADLGAGWGFLSAQVLSRADVRALHLVEADQTALDCAAQNISDARAVFHWADATTWHPPEPVDCVVMNPPFHTDRRADPELGRAFIRAAARILTRSGQMWMVANRHLPYEALLEELFAKVVETGGDTRFKILHATRPTRRGR